MQNKNTQNTKTTKSKNKIQIYTKHKIQNIRNTEKQKYKIQNTKIQKYTKYKNTKI